MYSIESYHKKCFPLKTRKQYRQLVQILLILSLSSITVMLTTYSYNLFLLHSTIRLYVGNHIEQNPTIISKSVLKILFTYIQHKSLNALTYHHFEKRVPLHLIHQANIEGIDLKSIPT